MTTREIANRLVAYIRSGEIGKAQEELYADDIVCIEPSETITQQFTKGKKAVIEKRKQFAAMIKELHGFSCSDPVVTGNYFTVSMSMDTTLKGFGRQFFEEIGIYEVKEEKIVTEQFLY
jgi:hypothetical protein